MEIVADKLSAAGWSWGYCSAVTQNGWRWIVDAHREGHRYAGHLTNCLVRFWSWKGCRCVLTFTVDKFPQFAQNVVSNRTRPGALLPESIWPCSRFAAENGNAGRTQR